MKIFAAVTFMLPVIALAEPSQSKLIPQKNSRCTVEKSAGEYPAYKVMRGKKIIFSPKSDGIVDAMISPSGKYVALSAGEVDLIDVKDNEMEFGVALVNCRSGKVAGYQKNKPTLIKKWRGDAALDTDSGTLTVGRDGTAHLPK